MIKKICNWTFGGFFRTLGRTFAFLLLGALFFIIAYKNGLNLDKLLGIASVNATTGSITSYNWRARYYTFPEPGSGDYGQGTWCSFISGSSKCSAGDNNIGSVSGFAFRGYYSGGYKKGNSYTFKYVMNVNNKTEILNNLSDINSNISNRQVALANGQYEGFTFYDDINPSIRFENSSTSNQLYVYISFISDVDFKTFAVAFDFNNGLYFGSVDWIQVTGVSVTYSEGVGAQIDNQTNIMNENQQTIINNIDNINDTLTDDHISDTDVSNSLNFSTTENSYGPFATFLTLPLQWVQDILASNQSCSPISLPLPYVNKNLVLPCMTEFWNSTGALGTLIQLCWIAVVGVRIFNGLFKLVVDTTSSEDNAEELTKIRSWEL